MTRYTDRYSDHTTDRYTDRYSDHTTDRYTDRAPESVGLATCSQRVEGRGQRVYVLRPPGCVKRQTLLSQRARKQRLTIGRKR